MSTTTKINLATVAMPLVEVMSSDGLSWSDREKCAAALRKVVKHFKEMENERVMTGMTGALAAQGMQTAMNGIRSDP